MIKKYIEGSTGGVRVQPGRLRFGLAAMALLLSLAVSTAALAGGAGAPSKLDLNGASVAELEALPGIGAVKAEAIVAERKARGRFDSVADLEGVRGIGPALVEKLKPLVAVAGPSSGSKAAAKRKSSARP